MGLHLGLQDMSELMASLLTTVLAEVLPGVLFVRWVQREFEDLLAVLIFSPVHGNRWLRSFAGAQATSSMMLAFRERRQGQEPLYIQRIHDTNAEDCNC